MTKTKKLITVSYQTVYHNYSIIIIMNSAMVEVCKNHERRRRKMDQISIFDMISGKPVFTQCYSGFLEKTLKCISEDNTLAFDSSNAI